MQNATTPTTRRPRVIRNDFERVGVQQVMARLALYVHPGKRAFRRCLFGHGWVLT